MCWAVCFVNHPVTQSKTRDHDSFTLSHIKGRTYKVESNGVNRQNVESNFVY